MFHGGGVSPGPPAPVHPVTRILPISLSDGFIGRSPLACFIPVSPAPNTVCDTQEQLMEYLQTKRAWSS